MINRLESWIHREIEESEGFRGIDLLSMSLVDKRNLARKIRRNSGLVTVLVHPYFREQEENCPFPQSEEYVVRRDSMIPRLIEEGSPLIILEEELKNQELESKVNALKGTFYSMATCEGEATPAILRRDSRYSLFMPPRMSRILETEVWDRVAAVLKDVGTRHLGVGGRYMVLHQASTPYGHRRLSFLREHAKHKKNAREILSRGLLPGACPGQFMINMLIRGFDVSLSKISSPTNSLSPTDLSNNPMQNFY